MGVGNHHGVQAGRVEGKVAAVAFFLFAAALTHAAIQQYLGTIAAFDQVAGAGYLLNGAEKVEQSHGGILSEGELVRS
ncbi:hypothetical protein D3C84_1278990 [compost metagenome]